MAYFCVFEDTTHTLTRVEIRAVQPEPVVEPPGWTPRYVADLGEAEGPLLGAQIVVAGWRTSTLQGSAPGASMRCRMPTPGIGFNDSSTHLRNRSPGTHCLPL